jgi:hypothetical protein
MYLLQLVRLDSVGRIDDGVDLVHDTIVGQNVKLHGFASLHPSAKRNSDRTLLDGQ